MAMSRTQRAVRERAVRERAVHNNDDPILYIDIVISPIFHNRCLSVPYLGKYKWD